MRATRFLCAAVQQPTCITTTHMAEAFGHHVGSHPMSYLLAVSSTTNTKLRAFDYVALEETVPAERVARGVSAIIAANQSVHQIIAPVGKRSSIGYNFYCDVDAVIDPPSAPIQEGVDDDEHVNSFQGNAALRELGLHAPSQPPPSLGRVDDTVLDTLLAIDVVSRHHGQPSLADQRVLVVNGSRELPNGGAKISFHIYAQSTTGGFADHVALRTFAHEVNAVAGFTRIDPVPYRLGGSLRFPFSKKPDGGAGMTPYEVGDKTRLTPRRQTAAGWLQWYTELAQDEIIEFVLRTRFQHSGKHGRRTLFEERQIHSKSGHLPKSGRSLEEWSFAQLEAAVRDLPAVCSVNFELWRCTGFLLKNYGAVRTEHKEDCERLFDDFSARCPEKYQGTRLTMVSMNKSGPVTEVSVSAMLSKLRREGAALEQHCVAAQSRLNGPSATQTIRDNATTVANSAENWRL